MIGKKIVAFFIDVILFVILFIPLLIFIYKCSSILGVSKSAHGWVENIFIIGIFYLYFYFIPKRMGNSFGRKILKIPKSTWRFPLKSVAKSEELSKKEYPKVVPSDGYWACPSCKEKNKELQDVCSNCGQEIENGL